jgi:hypothetical protein
MHVCDCQVLSVKSTIFIQGFLGSCGGTRERGAEEADDVCDWKLQDPSWWRECNQFQDHQAE